MKNIYVWLVSFIILCLIASCSTTPSPEEQEKAKARKVASIYTQLGMGYLGKGDMERAKQKLLLALQKDPTLPEAWYSMAYFLEKTGNKQLAEQDYLKAVKLAPAQGDVQNNYGTFLCRNGDYQRSVDHFLLATRDPQYLDSADAYENAGLCALKIPDKQQAVRYFNLSLEQDPTRMSVMTELTKLKT
jgi:type IV pilus assembly protein PilF